MLSASSHLVCSFVQFPANYFHHNFIRFQQLELEAKNVVTFIILFFIMHGHFVIKIVGRVVQNEQDSIKIYELFGIGIVTIYDVTGAWIFLSFPTEKCLDQAKNPFTLVTRYLISTFAASHRHST